MGEVEEQSSECGEPGGDAVIAATLFSGIGAPEVSMPHWQWPWHAEIEKFPSAVMAQQHPDSINLGDVTANDFCERAAAIARPDTIIFGSPCQSYSIAGKRLGLDDPRGNLALVALGIVARLAPRWFVFENVPGLLSSSEGSDFGIFLRTVDELGYSGAWASLDAQHFGLAQRRERLFFVGHSGDWRYPAAVLFEPESVCGDSPPRRETGKGIATTIAARTKGGGDLGTDFDCDGGLIGYNNTGQGWWTEGEVAAGIRDASAGGASHATVVTHALRADGFDASEDGTGRGTPLIAVAFAENSRAELRLEGGDGQTVCSLKCAGGKPGQGYPAIAFDMRGREGGEQFEGPHDTANIRSSNGGSSRSYVASSAVRRLTPRECERLQGFPDDYTVIAYRGKPAADGPRYKALGNSMAVPVLRWILTRIEYLDRRAS
jgi:DNA (cytosine-5)-methyltransferase 1